MYSSATTAPPTLSTTTATPTPSATAATATPLAAAAASTPSVTAALRTPSATTATPIRSWHHVLKIYSSILQIRRLIQQQVERCE